METSFAANAERNASSKEYNLSKIKDTLKKEKDGNGEKIKEEGEKIILYCLVLDSIKIEKNDYNTLKMQINTIPEEKCS